MQRHRGVALRRGAGGCARAAPAASGGAAVGAAGTRVGGRRAPGQVKSQVHLLDDALQPMNVGPAEVRERSHLAGGRPGGGRVRRLRGNLQKVLCSLAEGRRVRSRGSRAVARRSSGPRVGRPQPAVPSGRPPAPRALQRAHGPAAVPADLMAGGKARRLVTAAQQRRHGRRRGWRCAQRARRGERAERPSAQRCRRRRQRGRATPYPERRPQRLARCHRGAEAACERVHTPQPPDDRPSPSRHRNRSGALSTSHSLPIVWWNFRPFRARASRARASVRGACAANSQRPPLPQCGRSCGIETDGRHAGAVAQTAGFSAPSSGLPQQAQPRRGRARRAA